MRALDPTAVGEGDLDAVVRALDRLRPGPGEDVHALRAEDELEDVGGVLVLTGQDLLTGGHERDLGTEGPVGGGELGARDAGADDDEVFGQVFELVELGPGEDALTVGLRGGELTRVGADGEEDRRGPQRVLRAVVLDDLDAVTADELRAA